MTVYKEIGGARTYRSWKNWEIGEYIVGEFVEQYTDNYGKPGYAVKVVETNIKDLGEGKIIGLNSCGGLDYKMDKVSEGDTLKFEYDGTGILEKGKFAGKEFHQVKVFLLQDGVHTPESTQEVEGSEDDDMDIGL